MTRFYKDFHIIFEKYRLLYMANGRKASDCIKCGRCEKVCPQHLPIRHLLEDVAKEFERNK